MKIVINPLQDSWPGLIRRPALELEFLESSVRNIMNRVKRSGDHALRELAQQYDGATLTTLRLSDAERTIALTGLNENLKQAIKSAAANIRTFHEKQKREDLEVETVPGVVCRRKSIPVQRVGIYVPGGSAPLFSTVLMLGIPAQLAGCAEVILCTPPGKDGRIDAAIIFAASICGITNIFKAGGAQAIAAMAYGTDSIPAVYKIFGPGNQFVTMAKQLVSQEGIAIDLPAGPSEVLVIADETANTAFVAADLLSQAEHGPDSQVVLLTTSESQASDVVAEIEKQLQDLPRKAIAAQALGNSLAVCFSNRGEMIRFANAYAAEHVIINTRDCDEMSEEIVNAGSVFLGPYSPEAAGDYASGTNHTLPTNGWARAYSGVTLESFLKTITYQKLTKEGLAKIGPSVETMAEAEQLEAHKRAIAIRLRKEK